MTRNIQIYESHFQFPNIDGKFNMRKCDYLYIILQGRLLFNSFTITLNKKYLTKFSKIIMFLLFSKTRLYYFISFLLVSTFYKLQYANIKTYGKNAAIKSLKFKMSVMTNSYEIFSCNTQQCKEEIFRIIYLMYFYTNVKIVCFIW